jgi:hypothetical protein
MDRSDARAHKSQGFWDFRIRSGNPTKAEPYMREGHGMEETITFSAVATDVLHVRKQRGDLGG